MVQSWDEAIENGFGSRRRLKKKVDGINRKAEVTTTAQNVEDLDRFWIKCQMADIYGAIVAVALVDLSFRYFLCICQGF